MELQVLFHAVDVVEDVVDDARNNSLFARVADDSLHGVRLAGRRLTVRKDGSVVTTQHICNNKTRVVKYVIK